LTPEQIDPNPKPVVSRFFLISRGARKHGDQTNTSIPYVLLSLVLPYLPAPCNTTNRQLVNQRGYICLHAMGYRAINYQANTQDLELRQFVAAVQQRDYPFPGAASEGRTRTGGGQNARWKQIRP
jgi:hypothetical protein